MQVCILKPIDHVILDNHMHSLYERDLARIFIGEYVNDCHVISSMVIYCIILTAMQDNLECQHACKTALMQGHSRQVLLGWCRGAYVRLSCIALLICWLHRELLYLCAATKQFANPDTIRCVTNKGYAMDGVGLMWVGARHSSACALLGLCKSASARCRESSCMHFVRFAQACINQICVEKPTLDTCRLQLQEA